MRYRKIVGEDVLLTAAADDLFKVVNLPQQDTGIDGVICISTAEADVAPRVRWFPGRPRCGAACLSVSISDEPKATNLDVPASEMARAAPVVIEWVRLNKDARLSFWRLGAAWYRQEVAAHIGGLKKLGEP